MMRNLKKSGRNKNYENYNFKYYLLPQCKFEYMLQKYVNQD